MQAIIRLPDEMKIYYNPKIYSPEFSSLGTILLADKLIRDGQKLATTVLDVGCGSGVIGLGIKKLNPSAQVTLCDNSAEAVRVSKLNAKRLGLYAPVLTTDLLPKLGEWDIITANLPTYNKEDMKQKLYGPKSAYYAGEPLSLYARLLTEAKGRCKALVCECQAKYQEPFLLMAQGEGWKVALKTEFSFAFLA